MGNAAVLNDITEGKSERYIGNRSCANCDCNRETRRKCDQADLDSLLESIQRLNFVSRALWEMKDFDEVELGTVSIMIRKESDCIFELMGNLSDRLGE